MGEGEQEKWPHFSYHVMKESHISDTLHFRSAQLGLDPKTIEASREKSIDFTRVWNEAFTSLVAGKKKFSPFWLIPAHCDFKWMMFLCSDTLGLGSLRNMYGNFCNDNNTLKQGEKHVIHLPAVMYVTDKIKNTDYSSK